MRRSREELLATLEALTPGLVTGREILEHSACFVFSKKSVVTFNDEIYTRAPTPLPEVTGAVRAKPLLEILRKLAEKEIDVEVEKGHLVVKGKNRSSGVKMDADALLPLSNLNKPEDWHKVPDDFNEAVKATSACFSKSQTEVMWTCIHLHPDHLESCDDYQMIRYRTKLPVESSILVQGSSLKHTADMDVAKLCVTASWVWFKTNDGLSFACRRWGEDYQDLTGWLSVKGKSASLPRGLAEAAERANVFSREDQDDDQVLVELRNGRMRIRGEGASGWYSEAGKIRYDGPPVKFYVSPELLIQMVEKYSECIVNESALKVKGEKFVYVTRLSNGDE